MSNRIAYEFVREPIDEEGDIIDADHRELDEVDTLKQWRSEALDSYPNAKRVDIAIVRDEWCPIDGLLHRSWMYLDGETTCFSEGDWRCEAPQYIQVVAQRAREALA